MTRRRPITLPFARPRRQPRREARRIFEITLPPSELARKIIVECTGPDEAVAALKVRTFRVIG